MKRLHRATGHDGNAEATIDVLRTEKSERSRLDTAPRAAKGERCAFPATRGKTPCF
jgi:hypothetical protein